MPGSCPAAVHDEAAGKGVGNLGGKARPASAPSWPRYAPGRQDAPAGGAPRAEDKPQWMRRLRASLGGLLGGHPLQPVLHHQREERQEGQQHSRSKSRLAVVLLRGGCGVGVGLRVRVRVVVVWEWAGGGDGVLFFAHGWVGGSWGRGFGTGRGRVTHTRLVDVTLNHCLALPCISLRGWRRRQQEPCPSACSLSPPQTGAVLAGQSHCSHATRTHAAPQAAGRGGAVSAYGMGCGG